VRRKSEIGDPCNFGVLFEIPSGNRLNLKIVVNEILLGKCKGVVTVPLSSQTESLKTLQEKEGAKRVQARTDITEEFSSDFDSESSGTESLAKFEAMVAFSRLGESGKFARLCPIEFA
jgi:hypothetical protein